MGALFKGSKAPKVPDLPPAPPPIPQKTDEAITRAQQDARRRAALSGGRTALTAGKQGGLDTPASTAKKTALGA